MYSLHFSVCTSSYLQRPINPTIIPIANALYKGLDGGRMGGGGLEFSSQEIIISKNLAHYSLSLKFLLIL